VVLPPPPWSSTYGSQSSVRFLPVAYFRYLFHSISLTYCFHCQFSKEEERPSKKKTRVGKSSSGGQEANVGASGSQLLSADLDDSAHVGSATGTSPQQQQPVTPAESKSITDASTSRSESKGLTTPGAAGVPAPSPASMEFPAQLMDLLQRKAAPDAIWFLQEGEAIGINQDNIVEKVLNEHFRGMKFNSLVRNLNRW